VKPSAIPDTDLRETKSFPHAHRELVNPGAFSGTDSQNLLDRCHESWRVTSTFNDMGEIGPHFKCIVDNAIVDRVVHCEAFLSGVRRRLDPVNVHSIRNISHFQIVRRKDFDRQIEAFIEHYNHRRTLHSPGHG
jgi:hypothetical protein